MRVLHSAVALVTPPFRYAKVVLITCIMSFPTEAVYCVARINIVVSKLRPTVQESEDFRLVRLKTENNMSQRRTHARLTIIIIYYRIHIYRVVFRNPGISLAAFFVLISGNCRSWVAWQLVTDPPLVFFI